MAQLSTRAECTGLRVRSQRCHTTCPREGCPIKKLQIALLLAALLLPTIARAALTPEQIEAKLQQLDAKIEECSKLKAELEAMKAEIKGKPATPKASWADTIKISGYFQNRFENRKYNGANGYSDFFMRRTFINIIMTPNDRTTGVATIERAGAGDPGLNLTQAMVSYKLSDLYTVRFGQATNNFGIDAAQGSSVRIPLDRAMAAEGNGLLGLRGLWWRGWSDRGIWLIRKADGMFPQVTFGVMNGQFSDRGDAGLPKSVEADLKWLTPWGYFGASSMTGKYKQRAAQGDAVDGFINKRDAVGFYVFKKATPFGGQAEWINGTLPGLSASSPGDRNFNGWYLQGVYDKGGKGFPFVRFEEFDQNKDVPGIYRAWHLGYKYRLNPCNEITAQIDQGTNNNLGATTKTTGNSTVIGPVDMYGVQWQLSF